MWVTMYSYLSLYKMESQVVGQLVVFGASVRKRLVLIRPAIIKLQLSRVGRWYNA